MQNQPLIRVESLTRLFGRQKALDNVDLVIPQGTFVALAGPDGAGKTTLIRLLAALLLPTTGKVSIGGFDTATHPEKIHQLIGYMPQRFGLYEDLTVLENLTLYADLQNVVGQEREEKFQHLLAMMQLTPFTDRLAGALSGGMKQKLGLACTLIRTPKLLLLDEPSVGVDPISRRELWEMIRSFHAQGITIIWSTSYLDEAEKADLAVLLNEGKVLYQGPPKGLTNRVEGKVFKIKEIPGSKRVFLSQLLSQKGIEDATIQGNEIRVIAKEHRPDWMPCPPRFEDGFIDILGSKPIPAPPIKNPVHPQEKKVVIVAEGLTKRFGSFTAVDDISFEVQSGEVVGLLGPNGAGKSTTFRMLCGLLQPTQGRSFINGVSLQQAPSQARAQIGYMAQKFSLYGDLSVQQNLDFFSGVYNLTGEIRQRAITEAIDLFTLASFLHETTKDLPIGYKQRLALACALMHKPQVLFLDEPTSGVDPITRREFWGHINRLAEEGCTILVTTHFMDEAEYCDKVGLIYQSRLIHLATPDQLKQLANASSLEDAFIHLIERQK